MRVVLDTNIFVQNYRMTNSTFQVFLGQLKRVGHDLVILELVKDELINHFEEDLRGSKKKIDNIIVDIEKRISEEIQKPITEADISRLVSKYVKYFDNKLATLEPILVGYPNAKHKNVVKRALKRLKPFDGNGEKGYRDSLIWESILGLVQESNEPIAFVSQNDKDFADNNSKLHPNLLEDIIALGKPPEFVSYYKSLDEFNNICIQPNLEVLQKTADLLLTRDFNDFDLYHFLLNNISKFVGTDEFSPIDLGFPEAFESPTLWNIEDIEEIEDVKVFRLDENEVLIKVTIIGDMYFSCLIRNYYDNDDLDYEIWDSNWNDNYFFGVIHVPITRLLADIIFNESTKSVIGAKALEAEMV